MGGGIKEEVDDDLGDESVITLLFKVGEGLDPLLVDLAGLLEECDDGF